jgi:hypothetical protein|tara:strand:+ start:433 stop:783 length:351 start_codon:yes stop_codon:yes gene_type:complete
VANVLSTSRLKNVKTDLTTTNATTVYTCPALTVSVIQSMIVSEDSNNADTITVTITNGSDVFSVYKDKAVGAKGTVELFTRDLILTSSDIIKVTAGTANRLHVITSIVEIPKTTAA